MRGQRCTFQYRSGRCEERAGRRYGGFNGWCQRHAPKDAARLAKVAKFVGEAAAAAAIGEGLLKLIEIVVPHLARFRRVEPLSSLEEIEEGSVIGAGAVRGLLRSALRSGDEEALELALDLAERWWNAVPAPDRRDALTRMAGKERRPLRTKRK